MIKKAFVSLMSAIIGFNYVPYYEAEAYENFRDYNNDSVISSEDVRIIKDSILNDDESELDVFDLTVMKKYLIKKESSFRSHIDFNRSADIKRVNYSGQAISFGDTDYRLDIDTGKRLASLLSSVGYSKSFALYDLNTGGFIGYNLNVYYGTASTVKAPLVLSCMQSIDRGEHSLDEGMAYTSAYKSGGCGVIQYSPYGTVYDLETIMYYTITESDNVGYYMLQGHFGYDKYNKFLESLGNKVTIGGGTRWGQTSAYDSMKNWVEIYNYVTENTYNVGLFRDMLEHTGNSCIREALGDKYPVANKMGWIYNDCCHDHAYVMSESPYLLMIMTKGDAYARNENFIKDLAVLLDEIHDDYSKYAYLH